MAKVTIKNVSQGFRDLCLVGEPETRNFRPGEAHSVEIDDIELSDAVKTGWFEVANDLPQLDHDHDGHPGGSVSADGEDTAELRKRYEEIVGKRAFNGWDADELRKRIDDHLAADE